MRHDAARDGSGGDVSASHHPAFSSVAPFLVTGGMADRRGGWPDLRIQPHPVRTHGLRVTAPCRRSTRSYTQEDSHFNYSIDPHSPGTYTSKVA